MRAFIGTVPFTIIEAINYVVSNEIQDAVIFEESIYNLKKVGKQVEETGVFQNVYIVEDVLLTYPITVKKYMNVVKNGKISFVPLGEKNMTTAIIIIAAG